MSPPVIILDDAEEELKAAEEWYEAQRPGLGAEFRTAIEAAMAVLAAAPSAAPLVPGVDPKVGARRVFVRRFPYSVVFIAEPQAIWVLAFSHHRRRPRYWKTRL